jgi:hypothetical protein
LAPNYPNIARIAGEFLLFTKLNPEDEKNKKALYHNTALASTELRTHKKFTLLNPAKILNRSKVFKRLTRENNAAQQNGAAIIYINK